MQFLFAHPAVMVSVLVVGVMLVARSIVGKW